MAKEMDFTPDGRYYPVVYHNIFWVQSKQLMELDGFTAPTLPLTLSYTPIASWKVRVVRHCTSPLV